MIALPFYLSTRRQCRQRSLPNSCSKKESRRLGGCEGPNFRETAWSGTKSSTPSSVSTQPAWHSPKKGLCSVSFPTASAAKLIMSVKWCYSLFCRRWTWRGDLSLETPPPPRAHHPLWPHLRPQHPNLPLVRETRCRQPPLILAPKAVVAPAVGPSLMKVTPQWMKS